MSTFVFNIYVARCRYLPSDRLRTSTGGEIDLGCLAYGIDIFLAPDHRAASSEQLLVEVAALMGKDAPRQAVALAGLQHHVRRTKGKDATEV